MEIFFLLRLFTEGVTAVTNTGFFSPLILRKSSFLSLGFNARKVEGIATHERVCYLLPLTESSKNRCAQKIWVKMKMGMIRWVLSHLSNLRISAGRTKSSTDCPVVKSLQRVDFSRARLIWCDSCSEQCGSSPLEWEWGRGRGRQGRMRRRQSVKAGHLLIG